MQVKLASGKDLNTCKGPNTQVPAELSLSKHNMLLLLEQMKFLVVSLSFGKTSKFPVFPDREFCGQFSLCSRDPDLMYQGCKSVSMKSLK